VKEHVKVTGNKARQPETSAARPPSQSPAVSGNRSLELHIEELVLDGFSPHDRHRIGDAIERELAIEMAQQDFDPGSERDFELANIDAGTFPAKRADRPDRYGVEISRLLAGVIRRNFSRHKA
jgi:hypothetical protein